MGHRNGWWYNNQFLVNWKDHIVLVPTGIPTMPTGDSKIPDTAVYRVNLMAHFFVDGIPKGCYEDTLGVARRITDNQVVNVLPRAELAMTQGFAVRSSATTISIASYDLKVNDLEIFAANGRSVYRANNPRFSPSGMYTVSSAALPAGALLVRLSSADRSTFLRVVLQR
jgi:hypothetical protein